jgi:ubiquinone/menaquinone biosynthesis C-methylase UbiE
MGELGEFDTDTKALTARINAHAVYGSHPLEEWVFSRLDVRPGTHILELGCGTGKQTLPLARLVGAEGHVTAVDIAADSLSLLRQQALSEGTIVRITLIESGLDETGKYARGAERFDRAVACYSLYYANDPEHVLTVVHGVLKRSGRLFFCGPAHTNNAELKAFHHALSRRTIGGGAAPFMEETGQKLARQLFAKVEVSAFENPLSFSSAAALYEYWRSYNLYDPQLDSAFKAAASEYFHKHPVFTTYKRVVGVLAEK